MSYASSSTAEASETKAGHLPGDPDLWVFIVGEMVMFGAFFIAYIVNWAGDPQAFSAEQASLSRNLGVLNTLLLITGSWAVFRAVEAARQNRDATVTRCLGFAIASGVGFIAVKYFEYSAKIEAGASLLSSDFFMFYFCLTGIHLAHVVGGTVVLAVLWANARQGVYHSNNMKGLESGASYWHLVDLLWIFLFTLLYLLR